MNYPAYFRKKKEACRMDEHPDYYEGPEEDQDVIDPEEDNDE